MDFLNRVIYPIYINRIKNNIELDLKGRIKNYISEDEYKKIIDETADELAKRLVKI
jgi:hypothetical protein